MSIRRLPAPDTLPDLLLTMTAVCGEYPVSQVARLPGGAAYKENVVKLLKRGGLLRTYYRDSLRGLRLSASAKQLLLVERPDRFAPFLTGRSEPNVLKSEISRRLRLHRMAEVLTTMVNVGIASFRWEKPSLFPVEKDRRVLLPAYYTSREVKEIGPQGVKIKSSRATGILLVDGGIFLVYNTGPSQMKWEYRAELRLKALLQMELCQGTFAGQFVNMDVSGILFGESMEQMFPLMSETDGEKHNYFVLDGNLSHFYFLPSDHKGEVVLRLLCDLELRAALDQILSENLHACRSGWLVENDAIDANGVPVLFAYACDMPRIRRFDTALELHGLTGILICFDFQEEVLHRICGRRVTIQSIDFEQFERMVLHFQENSD